jgi:putative endonuclease
MYFVYILKSLKTNRYYTGISTDIKKRLKQHNSGLVKSTKPYRPWVLIYKEEFPDRYSAYKRERQIKRFKSGEGFRKLLR